MAETALERLATAAWNKAADDDLRDGQMHTQGTSELSD
jgi:hypothetical protein